MGEADRYQEYRHLKKEGLLAGSDNNALTALFIINSIFFLLLLTMQVVYFYYEQSSADFRNDIVKWFSVPNDFKTFTERPWTLLTFMFSDTGSNLLRIISNMIWLWAFGNALQQMTGNDKLIPIYIYGGVAGALVFLCCSTFISYPGNSHVFLIGANASVLAVATATTYLSPNHRFFTHIGNGVPLWLILTFFIIIDFISVVSINLSFGLSHLGGALAGFVFILLLKKGKDPGAWMNKSYDIFINLFNPHKKKQSSAIRNTVFYETGERKPFEKKQLINQSRVDEILDKINSKGFHFLTEEEKEILKKASEDDSLL